MSHQDIQADFDQLKNLYLAEAAEVEHLHKLRVFMRRLISCLPEDERQDHPLRQLIKASNRLRDMDVFLTEGLPQLLPHDAKLESIPKDIRPWKRPLHRAFVRALDEFDPAQLPNQTTAPRDEVVEQGDALNNHHYKSEIKALVQALSHENLRPKALHKLRLRVKHLRYGIERLPQPPQNILSHLVALQKHLGQLNDRKMWLKILAESLPISQKKRYKNLKNLLIQQMEDLRLAAQEEARHLKKQVLEPHEQYDLP